MGHTPCIYGCSWSYAMINEIDLQVSKDGGTGGPGRGRASSTQSLLCFEGRGMPSSASGCATTGATISFTFADVADTILTTTLGKILR